MAIFFTKNLYFRTRNSFMTLFFTQFVLSHASDNTTSRNFGGRMHGPSPTSNVRGGSSPPVPLGLRPWSSSSLSQL